MQCQTSIPRISTTPPQQQLHLHLPHQHLHPLLHHSLLFLQPFKPSLTVFQIFHQYHWQWTLWGSITHTSNLTTTTTMCKEEPILIFQTLMCWSRYLFNICTFKMYWNNFLYYLLSVKNQNIPLVVKNILFLLKTLTVNINVWERYRLSLLILVRVLRPHVYDLSTKLFKL